MGHIQNIVKIAVQFVYVELNVTEKDIKGTLPVTFPAAETCTSVFGSPLCVLRRPLSQTEKLSQTENF